MEEQQHDTNAESTNTPDEQPKAPESSSPPSSGPEPGKTSTNMDPNLAALLAYLFGWVSGLIFYLIETENKYVRFHALQSIFLSVAGAVVFIGLSIITGIFAAIPGIGLVMLFVGPLLSGVLGLGFLVLWVLLMVKAYQGEKWMLPVIGEMADKNS